MNLDPPACLSGFTTVELPPKTTIFRDGEPCRNFHFVLEGSIRVDLLNADGKSILLYRIGPSETCILSTSCLISDEDYCAQAITECAVKAISVPKDAFHSLLGDSEQFRQLVFQSFSSRLSTMMITIDQVSFSSLGKRLAGRLLDIGSASDEISVTHEQLANDLGSAREAISRKLQDWEKAGLISRRRGFIKICDKSRLQKQEIVGD